MIKSKGRSKSEEKRQLILSAATENFCEKGFSVTSMDSIAKSAGVSKQTVYSHFGNKDELFAAAISHRCSEFRMSSMPEALLKDPQVALKTFAKGFIELLLSKEGTAIHRVCISESQTNPKVSQLFFSAGPESVIKEISQLIANYSTSGLIKVVDCHMAAVQFLSMIKGEALMRREYNTEQQLSADEIAHYIDNTVDLFLRGYGLKDAQR
ncbi:hypothetical protein A9Q98_01410 [Thalassotalea sp. 42_200_T64]|nr:hypothetical protein A9Q98_01410 [Thalassotalea sp. 42_200_T64]